jgi:hypothetical protein
MMRSFLFAALALGCLASSHAVVPPGTYNGTSTSTVKFLDPNTLQVIATKRYSRKTTVVIAAPLAGEANPFSLNVKPTVSGSPPAAGDLVTASARNVSAGGTPLLLQYWSLTNTEAGFTGRFTDSHLPEGFGIDRLVAPLSTPSGALKKYRLHDARVAPGLQVTAVATKPAAKKIALTISGYAFIPLNAVVQFSTVINARKPKP